MKKVINIKVRKISDKKMTWEAAIEFAKKQERRLPSRIESLVLIEQSKEYGINLPDYWWTSDKVFEHCVWRVSKYGGTFAVFGNDPKILEHCILVSDINEK